ncbi:MAG: anti-sigma factor [Alphaproteobacteria bacterium]|nr:MAG: anti-sigma factor [Alphaproteobacteria bacterium]
MHGSGHESGHEPGRPVTREELHAYADGTLAARRRAEVTAYLESDPQAAARVAAYRRQNAALQEAFDPVLDEPVPARLLQAGRDRRAARWRAAVAACIGLIVGAAAGWGLHDTVVDRAAGLEELASRTAVAYTVYAPEVRHPVEVSAAEEPHLTAWLSKRMGFSFRVPRLGDLGFRLIGGRLMTGGTQPAALLLYEDDRGRRLAVYIRRDMPTGGRSELRYTRHFGIGVMYWTDGDRGIGVSGDVEKDELVAAAHLVQAQFMS